MTALHRPDLRQRPARRRRRLAIGAAAGAVLIGIGFGVDFLLHDYDPTRVVYKRLKAADEYVYEEVHPRFLEADPRAMITFVSAADASAGRERLIAAIWGADGYPGSSMPEPAAVTGAESGIAQDGTVARIDRMSVDMGDDVRSLFSHFQPAVPNGRLVLYHHGYAGTYEDNRPVIERLVGEGYAVMAFNQMAYGGNTAYIAVPGGRANLHYELDKIDRPLRYHFQPVIAALNYAEQRYDYSSIDMIGFSAGGFVTAVVAALDPRIRRSYPVAGVYPVYLRSGQEESEGGPQYYKPMLDAANYLDMFVLGVDDAKRRQVQVFNRFDRCCFNNLKGRVYEAPVRDAAAAIGGGSFAVLIDETHADHKISDFALDHMIEDMAQP